MAPVPESLLKKRQRDEKWAADKAAAAETANKSQKDKKDVIFKKAEAYVQEYRAQVHTPRSRRCTSTSLCMAQQCKPHQRRSHLSKLDCPSCPRLHDLNQA